MAYLLALEHQKMCLSRASVRHMREVEILAKKKPCVFCFKRGLGIEMYEMTVICLDGSKKCKFLSFFSRLLFVDLLRDGLRDARGAERKSGQDFYGEEKLGGWDFVGPGTSHFLLGTR